MRVTFQQIKKQSKAIFICKKCNKQKIRQITFDQTLNPFNKNKDGFIKTADEIQNELNQRAAEWEAAIDLCAGCEE